MIEPGQYARNLTNIYRKTLTAIDHLKDKLSREYNAGHLESLNTAAKAICAAELILDTSRAEDNILCVCGEQFNEHGPLYLDPMPRPPHGGHCEECECPAYTERKKE